MLVLADWFELEFTNCIWTISNSMYLVRSKRRVCIFMRKTHTDEFFGMSIDGTLFDYFISNETGYNIIGMNSIPASVGRLYDVTTGMSILKINILYWMLCVGVPSFSMILEVFSDHEYLKVCVSRFLVIT